jgi:hypothetical protein
VEKDQVDEVVPAAHGDSKLAVHKAEVAPQFVDELLEVVEQGLLQV